ncbi:NeuD/PglB/VioB family sugar acetyltransferase [Geothrix sp. 21YS21S-4]|uniref:NeuD/PglB/VioB family sugar acetyltransferase n=1 Tax=Geothrix sp. 21YS21S-4 TaxID=3068889 RepID=UPI0027B95842|nr:NeuD/PglB/VioB family sugar acetyltransferase [Geothrix sp. 21YS21S-4]
MSETVLVGAGGHARVVLTTLRLNGVRVVGIYDDVSRGDQEYILGVPVVGGLHQVPTDANVILACGDIASRANFAERFANQLDLTPIIHPSAILEAGIILGDYVQIMGGTVINAGAQIGRGTLINTGAVIEHEAVVGEFCHVSINAVLCGRAKLGDRCFLGAGAVVRDCVSIAAGVTVGINGAVTRDIIEAGIYAGVPARKIK